MLQKNKARGFTLIELLVVIAIISILTAILFPVFARARENARRASCLSNLKQIGLGVMMYVQDYDEYYPVYSYASGTTPEMPSSLWSNRGGGGYNWYWPAQLFSYTKSAQVFRCPSSSFDTNVINMNYGVNNKVVRVGGAGPIGLAAVESSSTTYMLMDAGTYQVDYKAAYTASGFQYIPGSKEFSESGVTDSRFNAPDDWEKGRHFQGVNMAFADGHVKWLKSSVLAEEAKKCGGISTCPRVSAWNPLLDNS